MKKKKVFVLLLGITNIILWLNVLSPSKTWQTWIIISVFLLMVKVSSDEDIDLKHFQSLAAILLIWRMLKDVMGKYFWIPLIIFVFIISWRAAKSAIMQKATEDLFSAVKNVKVKDLKKEDGEDVK